MIFEEKERTGAKPILRGEYLIDFYDRVGGKAFDAYREIINSWISRVPEEDSKEIIARMCSHDDLNYDSALTELIVHEIFLRLSYTLTFHPQVDGTKSRPDFLATSTNGNQLAYLEVTTINPPAVEVGRDNREGVIFEALNALEMAADLRLMYSVKDFGAASPSIKKLKRAVLAWVAEYEDAARDDHYVQKDFRVDDWCFDLALIGGASERPDARRIAIWGDLDGDFTGELKSPEGLTKALESKATKYSDLDQPYVIVVFDRTETLAWFESDFVENVAQSLFGQEVHEEVKMISGEVIKQDRRDTDGWFGYPEKPKNSNVSAVIVFPQVSLWYFAEKRGQPLLVKNPWATNPVASELPPFLELIMTKDDVKVSTGPFMSEILNFPSPWPIPEED